MVLEIYPTVVMWHNFIGLFRGRQRTESPFFCWISESNLDIFDSVLVKVRSVNIN